VRPFDHARSPGSRAGPPFASSLPTDVTADTQTTLRNSCCADLRIPSRSSSFIATSDRSKSASVAHVSTFAALTCFNEAARSTTCSASSMSLELSLPNRFTAGSGS